jgi:hypothetical protein
VPSRHVRSHQQLIISYSSLVEALHKMIDVAEDAMEAVEERNKLAWSSDVITTGPNQTFRLQGDNNV